MWRRLPLLFLCCALSGLDALEADKNADPAPAEAADPGKLDKEAPSAARAEDSQRGGQQPTAEPLEEEMDNQENIISQVSVCARQFI